MGLSLLGVAIFAMATFVQNYASAEFEVSKSSQLFAARAYQELKGKPGNIVMCPVSVQTILALVQAGAQEDTSEEIQRTLFLPADKSLVQQGYQSLMTTLNSAKDVELDIANNVYVKQEYKLNSTFQQIATKSFCAGIENIDFSNSAGSSQKINQWVEQKTHNKIKNLISPDMITPDTRMVLVNAVYFKGMWEQKFEKSNTQERDFWISAAQSVKTPMMSQTGNFKYAENQKLDCKFLQMPYKGNEYAMTIVLPNKKDGLAALENVIDQVLQPQDYKDERVEVYLPLFKVEYTIQFTEVLKAMGMTKSFDSNANFKGLLQSGEDLSISAVIQKNFIHVTEDGTEAASATGVGVVTLSLQVHPAVKAIFNADHPFLYFLHLPDHHSAPDLHHRPKQDDVTTMGTVLFVGRISQL